MATSNDLDIGKTFIDLDEDAQANLIDEIVEETYQSYKDQLKECLAHINCDFNIDESIKQVNLLLESVPLMGVYTYAPKEEPLALSPSHPFPSIVELPKLDLRPLSDTLKYAFLGPNETLPVIIASNLDESQENKLLEVLDEHKEAIGWSIADIKETSPTVMMHKIHLEENAMSSREPRRRLNPLTQEVRGVNVIGSWVFDGGGDDLEKDLINLLGEDINDSKFLDDVSRMLIMKKEEYLLSIKLPRLLTLSQLIMDKHKYEQIKN